MTADTTLRGRIEAAARAVPIRLGPNALAMAQRGEPIILNFGEAAALADTLLPLITEAMRDGAGLLDAHAATLTARLDDLDTHVAIRRRAEARQWEAAASRLRARAAAEDTRACPGYETEPTTCGCACEGCQHNCAAHDDQAAELTADEARELAAEISQDLYRTQDAIAFVGECCDIADREGRTITTADVRVWLAGPQCAREAGLVLNPDGHSSKCADRPGIRGLLEHVGIDTEGRDIAVDGTVVDTAEQA